ncbi:CLOCK-interacting pacemaker-like [Heteronotia binoei]|uniref:CLOCK-interacting pacemaker-like n=1 Tax=Heteronotia binoei TaxID=13085 RepID=UPI00292DADA9|nr:CLOCK-interacting pacemaker-like [Heteronotia binoei]
MPSGQPSPPGHPSKPGKKTGPARSSKSECPDSKGRPVQAEKMAAGLKYSGKSHHSLSEVEKDSGFSDVSSEYLSTVEQTDTEDQSASSLRRPPKLQRAPQKASGGLPGGTFASLAPVYFVRNVALKQPPGGPSAPTQFLAWGSQHSLNGLQGPPARVLLIQQPLATLKPLLPNRKSAATKATYPASLSTYPKIAPHPGLDRQPKAAGLEAALTGDNVSRNKRFCLEEAWVSSSKPAAAKRGGEKQGGEPPPPPASSDPPAVSQNAVTSSTGCGMAGLEQAEVRMISRASKKLGFSSLAKQRRFHNTVEILRRSGLLGITLRTKELIRQSSNTQRDLAELREQAQLLCEAVQSNDTLAWTRLQEAVDRSADYWASKGAASHPLRGQSLPAEATDSSAAEAQESPPSSPVNLSLAPAASSVGPELP